MPVDNDIYEGAAADGGEQLDALPVVEATVASGLITRNNIRGTVQLSRIAPGALPKISRHNIFK
ncbi:MAG: hypothetical protein H6667_14250 [Ardenticatenaceae bacterium]|nr:hypothetical protein [Ardenticatenaceae bacterium]